MNLVTLETPQPESRREVLEALRAGIHYATMANIARVDIILTYSQGASVTISSDE